MTDAPPGEAPSAPPGPRTIGPRVVAVLLFAMGLNALVQVPRFLPGWGDDPPALSALQALCATAGLGAGFGAWRRQAWAWIAALLYGLATGTMILSLGPLLGLSEGERKGLPLGATMVVALCACFAWYLRRTHRTATP